MKLFVGITDRDWFNRLSTSGPDEVNFWKPGEQGGFASLRPGELFLFKLHAPNNFIVGGGTFVRFSKLPVSLAWQAFGEKNGVANFGEFIARIKKYRKDPIGPDPVIGNIILSEPFWFDREAWIPAPADWPKSTVQGKGYDALEGRGYEIYSQVRARLGGTADSTTVADLVGNPMTVHESVARYRQAEVNLRLGQGGFRVTVTDAYQRRCAITGESTLPVLEAAHIRPYAEEGPHSVRNGMLLRSDMHTLFDKGLLTVTPELKLEVSGQIREQYTNGKLYYSYHGTELRSLPQNALEQPDPEFLAWHNENVFTP
jgi:putative restriction endonuclease